MEACSRSRVTATQRSRSAYKQPDPKCFGLAAACHGSTRKIEVKSGDSILIVAGWSTAGTFSPGMVYSYSIPSPGTATSGYVGNGNLLSFTDLINGQWTATYDMLNQVSTATLTGTPTLTWRKGVTNRTYPLLPNVVVDK
jgi:hypothetical protein